MSPSLAPRSVQALPAPELLSTVTWPGMDAFQVTTDPLHHTHVLYNYRDAVEPTSRYILLQRRQVSAPRNQLLLCDLQEGFALTCVHGPGDCDAGCFSRDGRFVYHAVLDERELTIRRYALADQQVDTVFAIPRCVPDFQGRRILATRWLTFSPDGRRLLITVSLQGQGPHYSMAVFTFDMVKLVRHTTFETGPRNWNAKNCYAPSLGPAGEYLIATCDCFSQARFDRDGQWHCDPIDSPRRGGGAEYLVNEEGLIRFAYPVGCPRHRETPDHNYFFDHTLRKIHHLNCFDSAPHWRGVILLTEPVPVTEQTKTLGRALAEGNANARLDLTRHIARPDVWHIYVDPSAGHLLCDTIGVQGEPASRYSYAATIKHDRQGPYIVPRYLINPASSWSPYWCETLPCATPDGRWILFNSDYNQVQGYQGPRHVAQVFALRGFEFPQ